MNDNYMNESFLIFHFDYLHAILWPPATLLYIRPKQNLIIID